MIKSVKFVGVGGQGTILATKVLAGALIDAGYDVKTSEIHGMSQRGGSVSSEIRFGNKVYSPVIEKHQADFLVAFELMEAERYLDYLKKEGVILLNNQKINSMVTLNGKIPYPRGIVEDLEKKANVHVFNAEKKAQELGNPKVMNIIMLGAFAAILDENLDFHKSIINNVKEKYHQLNIKAFDLGFDMMQKVINEKQKEN
jgi:indolepyruvate ferredoxin oxidoreductase beta subunit